MFFIYSYHCSLCRHTVSSILCVFVSNLACTPRNEVATLVQLFGSAPGLDAAFGKSDKETKPLRMICVPLKMGDLFLKSLMEGPVNMFGVGHGRGCSTK